ncbi:hypothetical protein NGTWS0302_27690 [Mycolicibacterium cyprinidarum]|uniref:Transmembrane protein n=1 Tax=Mycolicibacterium cyprinidarum TaxID=2860311 RepID=A0ABQ4V4S6_9MYCO|nr:hypothetical protein NGTWS1803_11900 [Mycolicibacterium sp. NGTWS1803]GJF09150.1 hypothetical protein NGTWS1702_32370 [Mycolicibacterium sp. NGTWSNA01]GJF11002.1 hypothetical protein NGTWS0302_27690 [Mycolicibacterium sp. NGTWS0302]
MADGDRQWPPGDYTQPFTPEFTGAFTAQGVMDEPVAPVTLGEPAARVVPGADHSLNRWRLLFVVTGVWIAAAAVGLGLYYWWYHSLDKTMPVFVVLVYLVACIVGSLLSALIQNRPVLSATAIALMSAPFASTAAAAVLFGGYVFGWISR